jgi:hypothetical protein
MADSFQIDDARNAGMDFNKSIQQNKQAGPPVRAWRLLPNVIIVEEL